MISSAVSANEMGVMDVKGTDDDLKVGILLLNLGGPDILGYIEQYKNSTKKNLISC